MWHVWCGMSYCEMGLFETWIYRRQTRFGWHCWSLVDPSAPKAARSSILHAINLRYPTIRLYAWPLHINPILLVTRGSTLRHNTSSPAQPKWWINMFLFLQIKMFHRMYEYKYLTQARWTCRGMRHFEPNKILLLSCLLAVRWWRKRQCQHTLR